MSKKQIKKFIFMGVGCALLLIVGTIYSYYTMMDAGSKI